MTSGRRRRGSNLERSQMFERMKIEIESAKEVGDEEEKAARSKKLGWKIRSCVNIPVRAFSRIFPALLAISRIFKKSDVRLKMKFARGEALAPQDLENISLGIS